MRVRSVGICAVVTLGAISCGSPSSQPTATASLALPTACELALAPFSARLTGDQEILDLQQAARRPERLGAAALENLAYRFVRRARLSYDAADYTRAEEAARCLEDRQPGEPQATLIRGHVLHQQHRFAEAETLARGLVRDRGNALDFGLLGDALMEQGRIDDAVTAYQRMADLKPHFQSYTRAAHVRWLKGDLEGATELMERAVTAASPRDAESLAWAETRLAQYALQAKRFSEAESLIDRANARVADYAPGLLWRGRLELARNRPTVAVASLRKAAALAGEPDYLWALADALRATDAGEEATRIEATIHAEGGVRDPRTLALFASTRTIHGHASTVAPDAMVELVAREEAKRQDIFTLDAEAWALTAAGRASDAYPLMERATTLGTKDARLLYHAAVVASEASRPIEARRWFNEATALQHMLLPSERQDLLSRAARARGRKA